MKVVSVVNYKGGVGKTTFVANIAAKLAKEGKKVLLIDLDPQGSLTFSLMHPDVWQKNYSKSNTIKNWFNGKLNKKSTNIKEYVITDLDVNKKYTTNSKVGLISSHLELFNISLEMAKKLNGSEGRNFAKNKLECLYMLKRGLETFKNEYDYIFIDCQPSFDLITQNAIVVSDYYFIPTKLDYLSTLGIESLISHIDKLNSELNSYMKKFTFEGYSINPKLLGVAANMVTIAKGNDLVQFNEIEKNKLEKNSRYKLFKNNIRNNSEFMNMGDLLPAIAKKADNETRKNIVKEIESIVKEFEESINER